MPVIVQRAEKNVYVCVQLCQVYAATTKSSLGRIELVLQKGMERHLPKVAKGFVDHTPPSASHEKMQQFLSYSTRYGIYCLLLCGIQFWKKAEKAALTDILDILTAKND